jgi:hypothetical protein
MSNKILNFDAFVKGPKLNDPKTALSVKPADGVHMEKSIDQVKRLNLGKLDVNEPDYSKTVSNPVMEGTVEDNQVKIDDLNIQLKNLDQKDPGYLQKKRDLDSQIATLTKAIEDAKNAATAKVK